MGKLYQARLHSLQLPGSLHTANKAAAIVPRLTFHEVRNNYGSLTAVAKQEEQHLPLITANLIYNAHGRCQNEAVSV
jgi:hypothetical protein